MNRLSRACTRPAIWACFPWGLSVGAGGAVTYPNIPHVNFAAPSCSPGWDYNLESTPYTMQYNLNVQREIAPGTILTVGYIGSRGLHGLTEVENNPPLVCTFAQGPDCANPSFANGVLGGYFGYGTPGAVKENPLLNPGLGSFPNVEPVATSRYNSVLVSVTRRFARNLAFTASYTYSRCLTDGGWLGSFNSNGQSEFEDPYNLNIDKAICAYNQSQVFKTTSLYALPFHGNQFVEGWQLSGIVTANSGLPLTITNSYDESTGGQPGQSPHRVRTTSPDARCRSER